MPIILKPADALAEIARHRTPNSKRFDLGNGMQRLIQRVGRVHYRDDQQTLQDIELTPEIDPNTGEIVANHVPYRFRVHLTGVGLDYQSREDSGIVTVKLDKIGNKSFNRSKKLNPVIQGNRIVYHDVADGLDMAFEITRFGVRTYRILKDSSADREWSWEVEHDDIGEAKVRKNKITGQDASERRVNVSVNNAAKVSTGNGKYTYITTENWNGEVEHTDPTTRIKSWKKDSEVSDVYPIAIDPDVTENIGTDADDGFEQAYQPWQSTNTRDDIGKYFAYLHPAWRFQTVAVAPGATIAAARLILNSRSSTSGGGGGKLYGYDVDSAAALSNTVKPTTMAKTTANTTVTPSTATGLRTFDVTSLVAEIVARGGWASGNNMTIFGIGTTGGYSRTRFEDYADGGTDEAQLEIDFPGSGQPARIRMGGIPYAAINMHRGTKITRVRSW
jgi:hypothetical protein